jgi:CSLREA domain-containing protein
MDAARTLLHRTARHVRSHAAIGAVGAVAATRPIDRRRPRSDDRAEGRRPARSRVGRLVVVPLLALATALGSAGAAEAATITVTSDSDATTGSACTLREAIESANADTAVGGCAAGSGDDTIRFNIPGTGVKTIRPTSPLPEITRTVTIDGYTQPGARVNNLADASNAIILIELDGSQAGNASGLVFRNHENSVVKGLAVGNFDTNSASIGIHLDGFGHQVIGNFIGTDATGTVARPNAVGVRVGLDGQSQVNFVGLTKPEERNVISGNGIGVEIRGGETTLTLVLNNLIGTTRTGTAKLPNTQHGVVIGFNSDNNIIGGAQAGARNVISGNGFDGVRLTSSGSTTNVVVGNFIGTDVTGTADLGNGGNGVSIGTSAAEAPFDNDVGGITAGEGNLIAFNDGAGVVVPAGIKNRINSNRIFGNGGLGIDLGPAGVTPNDGDDNDIGANNLQNFPVITSASTRGDATSIGGTLTSRANTSFRVELYASSACAPSGHGQGERLLKVETVATNGGGVATFLASVPAIPPGQVVTAIATDNGTGETSEFSACKAVQPAGIVVSEVVGQTTEAGGTATFTVALTSTPAAAVTIPLSSSDATEGRVSPASVTFTPANALTPQTVTVTGLDDPEVDGTVAYAVVLAAARSDDPAYKDLDAPDARLANQDNDAACAPRPQVTVQTAPAGPGALRVTLTAATTPTAPNNRLVRIELQAGTNATVDAGDRTGLRGPASVPLEGRPAAATMTVRRASPGQAVHQPFVVVDDCGGWTTFVGGGPNAF